MNCFRASHSHTHTLFPIAPTPPPNTSCSLTKVCKRNRRPAPPLIISAPPAPPPPYHSGLFTLPLFSSTSHHHVLFLPLSSCQHLLTSFTSSLLPSSFSPLLLPHPSSPFASPSFLPSPFSTDLSSPLCHVVLFSVLHPASHFHLVTPHLYPFFSFSHCFHEFHPSLLSIPFLLPSLCIHTPPFILSPILHHFSHSPPPVTTNTSPSLPSTGMMYLFKPSTHFSQYFHYDSTINPGLCYSALLIYHSQCLFTYSENHGIKAGRPCIQCKCLASIFIPSSIVVKHFVEEQCLGESANR